jgi:hypothetical protein
LGPMAGKEGAAALLKARYGAEVVGMINMDLL